VAKKITLDVGLALENDSTLSAQNRLKMTAKVAVSVSLLSTMVLLAAFYLLLIDQAEKTYLQTILALTRSQEQLAIAMLIGGALVTALAGLITWAFTLYFSHRIAGPIYRFTKNLELEIEKGPVTTVAIRKEDSLQVLSEKLGLTVDRLSRHYDNQLKIVDEISRNLHAADGINVTAYNEALEKLKNVVNSQS
jgi:hypothetical protein